MYKLYNVKGWGSLAPHMLLERLGVGYESRWMTPAEVKDPAFRKISPLGYVPALELADGRVMFESLAIMIYLTDAHPSQLAPRPGTAEHGEYLAWLTFLSVNVYGSINMESHGEIFAADAAGLGHLRQVAGAQLKRMFGIVEERLSRNGPFMMGKTAGAVDYYLYMLTRWTKPDPETFLKDFPHVAHVAQHVASLPELRGVLRQHDL